MIRSLRSDSLIASLCREAASLSQRSDHLQQALIHCGDPRLRRRLAGELDQLRARLADLLVAARHWPRRACLDPLGPALLVELCRRSLARV